MYRWRRGWKSGAKMQTRSVGIAGCEGESLDCHMRQNGRGGDADLIITSTARHQGRCKRTGPSAGHLGGRRLVEESWNSGGASSWPVTSRPSRGTSRRYHENLRSRGSPLAGVGAPHARPKVGRTALGLGSTRLSIQFS